MYWITLTFQDTAWQLIGSVYTSGTRRLKLDTSRGEPDGKKIDTSRRKADWFLLAYPTQTPVLLSGPA